MSWRKPHACGDAQNGKPMHTITPSPPQPPDYHETRGWHTTHSSSKPCKPTRITPLPKDATRCLGAVRAEPAGHPLPKKARRKPQHLATWSPKSTKDEKGAKHTIQTHHPATSPFPAALSDYVRRAQSWPVLDQQIALFATVSRKTQPKPRKSVWGFQTRVLRFGAKQKQRDNHQPNQQQVW